MDNTLRICTWNIKGIHNPIKRKKVLSYIRKEKIGIALQTTYNSSLLWETSKAYIRGLILSFSVSKKRKKKETQRL